MFVTAQDTVICKFTLCVLHNVYQMKQLKVSDGKFFIRNLSNVLQNILKVSDDELSVRKANLIWTDPENT